MPRHHDHWIRAYTQFTSLSEAPLEFHFWTAVSTIAAVLKRRVWRDELTFKWTPNFYIIFVGPAGVVTKSTSLNLGYQILRQVKLPDGGEIIFGPDSMTWHGLAKKFEAATEFAEYLDPVTGEKKTAKMAPLTCSISELGTFLRPDDKQLVSFLTDVWDGKERPFEHVTLTNPELLVENPWLNVIGATTPDWIQENFPPGLVQQGIGSRIIFVYGERKRHLVAYPSRLVIPKDYRDQERRLIEDLEQIAKLCGPYDLTDEAFSWGDAWYAKHHSSARPKHAASARYAGYMARKQMHIHKLAMVLAAAQRDRLLITADDLQTAEKILETTEQSMVKVFESVGQREEARWVGEIKNYVSIYKWITADELYQLCFHMMSKQEFIISLREALDAGVIKEEFQGNRKGYISGRPN